VLFIVDILCCTNSATRIFVFFRISTQIHERISVRISVQRTYQYCLLWIPYVRRITRQGSPYFFGYRGGYKSGYPRGYAHGQFIPDATSFPASPQSQHGFYSSLEGVFLCSCGGGKCYHCRSAEHISGNVTESSPLLSLGVFIDNYFLVYIINFRNLDFK